VRDDGEDINDIKKQEEILQESYMMIPDSKNRRDTVIEEPCKSIERIFEIRNPSTCGFRR